MRDTTEGNTERIYNAAVCPFCACLCDDVVIRVRNNEIEELRNACRFGVAKFRSHQGRLKRPAVDGKPTNYEDAIARAVDILKGASKPLIYGLSNSSYEAQQVALRIAKYKRGVIDVSESICHNLLYAALKAHYPFYYALLDEIRDKATVIVYWGSNPVVSHPRHLARYSVYPAGRYAMKGVTDRTIIAIDVIEPGFKKQWFVQVKPGEDAMIANALTQLLKGEPAGECNQRITELRDIADKLRSAMYGVIFIGLGVLAGANADENIKAILTLVDTLNKTGRRYVIFPMKGHYNVMGAVLLLMRETGYPFGVDFSSDKRFEPGKTTVMGVLKEVDAALIVGADPVASLPAAKVRDLLDIPLIVLDPFESPTMSIASVALPVAITGVESEGIAYRMDGLPLKLDKIINSEYPSDKALLEQIYEGLQQ